MAAITTTSDYLTWDIEPEFHTGAEIDTYVSSLDITDTSSVSKMVVQMVDKIILVNGMPVLSPIFGRVSQFNDALGDGDYLNGNRVKAYHYFADRDKVLVEYLTHPLDDLIPNTFHTLADLPVLATMFAHWKSEFQAARAGTIEQLNFVYDNT